MKRASKIYFSNVWKKSILNKADQRAHKNQRGVKVPNFRLSQKIGGNPKTNGRQTDRNFLKSERKQKIWSGKVRSRKDNAFNKYPRYLFSISGSKSVSKFFKEIPILHPKKFCPADAQKQPTDNQRVTADRSRISAVKMDGGKSETDTPHRESDSVGRRVVRTEVRP